VGAKDPVNNSTDVVLSWGADRVAGAQSKLVGSEARPRAASVGAAVWPCVGVVCSRTELVNQGEDRRGFNRRVRG